jgi:hypothetical protein
MTRPYERTRSLIKTYDFLKELSKSKEQPESIRDHAKWLLRHFPDHDVIYGLGKFEEYLIQLTPEDPKRELLIYTHLQVLSSSSEH